MTASVHLCKLGTLPPAVVSFATTAKAQPPDHANAWSAIVTGAGYAKVTTTDPAVTPTVKSDFAQVKDVPGLANLALTLEDIAAATYLNALGVVTSKQAISTAATIQPVEMQRRHPQLRTGQVPGSQCLRLDQWRPISR